MNMHFTRKCVHQIHVVPSRRTIVSLWIKLLHVPIPSLPNPCAVAASIRCCIRHHIRRHDQVSWLRCLYVLRSDHAVFVWHRSMSRIAFLGSSVAWMAMMASLLFNLDVDVYESIPHRHAAAAELLSAHQVWCAHDQMSQLHSYCMQGKVTVRMHLNDTSTAQLPWDALEVLFLSGRYWDNAESKRLCPPSPYSRWHYGPLLIVLVCTSRKHRYSDV